jgi:hypothetical protein
MRLVTWGALVAASVASMLVGRVGVALGLAAFKAALLGLSFMELRGAARPHAVAWLGFVAGVAGLLAALS